MKLKQKLTLKPNTYYKLYYKTGNFDVIYIDNEWVYEVAYKYTYSQLHKYDKYIQWTSIKNVLEKIQKNNYKIEEISKEELFLELL